MFRTICPCSVEAGTTSLDGLMMPGGSTVVVGLAVSWCDRDAYYVALTDTSSHCKTVSALIMLITNCEMFVCPQKQIKFRILECHS